MTVDSAVGMEAAEPLPEPEKKPEDDEDESIVSSIQSKLRQETVREILRLTFNDPKTKLTDDSLALVNEILRMLVLETALRAAKQTVRDHRTVIEIEQIEKILPQLMLDFP